MKKLIASVLAAAALAGAVSPAFAAWGQQDRKVCVVNGLIESRGAPTQGFMGHSFRVEVDGDFARLTILTGENAGRSTPYVFAGTNDQGTRWYKTAAGNLLAIYADAQGFDRFILGSEGSERRVVGACPVL